MEDGREHTLKMAGSLKSGSVLRRTSVRWKSNQVRYLTCTNMYVFDTTNDGLVSCCADSDILRDTLFPLLNVSLVGSSPRFVLQPRTRAIRKGGDEIDGCAVKDTRQSGSRLRPLSPNGHVVP